MNQRPTRSTPTVGALQVPGATLHYEVRGNGPLVALVAAPMDAAAFEPLADLLATDHTVLTADPRGINRSPVEDASLDVTPQTRTEDLSRLLLHLDAGPAAVLGSSGAALSVLDLAVSHPELVHTVIAHEPPVDRLTDDPDKQFEATDDIVATYLSGDHFGAWGKFLDNAGIVMPDDEAPMMPPGEPDPQQAADEQFFFERMMHAISRWEPDVPGLRTTSTRIVIAIGEQSVGQLCDLTSTKLATAIGTEPIRFPGDHTGFVDDPEAFAARLREVLRDR